jgi:hypothetical protein
MLEMIMLGMNAAKNIANNEKLRNQQLAQNAQTPMQFQTPSINSVFGNY